MVVRVVLRPTLSARRATVELDGLHLGKPSICHRCPKVAIQVKLSSMTWACSSTCPVVPPRRVGILDHYQSDEQTSGIMGIANNRLDSVVQSLLRLDPRRAQSRSTQRITSSSFVFPNTSHILYDMCDSILRGPTQLASFHLCIW